MANTLSNIIAQTNSNGDIISIIIDGTTDNTCASLRLEVIDPNTGEILLTGPVVINGNSWTKSFTAPDDFSASDLVCNMQLNIVLKCRDTNPGQVVLNASGTITCNNSICNITIDSLNGVPAVSSGLQSLEVKGTSSCLNVDVTVKSGSISITRNNINVDATGNWQTTFVMGDAETLTKLKSFKCKDLIDAEAKCSADASCTVNTTIEIVCNGNSPCPTNAIIRVTGPNGFDKTNPTDAEMQCLPFGDYTITCATPAIRYNWSSGDAAVTGTDLTRNVVRINGNLMVIRYGANNLNSHFSVIAVKDVNCLPLATVAFHCGINKPPNDGTITPPPNGGPITSPPNDNDVPIPPNDDNNNSTRCDLCCIWFIANIVLVLLTLVAFVVAGCVFQFGEPISLTTAISLAVASTISFIAWAIFCRSRSGNSCRPLLRWLDILDMLTILATVVAFLMGTVTPCAIAFWINVGFLQWIRRILQSFAVFFGCLPNPWWGNRGQ